ncbi:uncharacterized protein LOC130948309 [Arachis stenosperma]|uniref:uncharacterized protein LOC130948309 n=1 Tax=Arachis stenosperma TaxID=217475 RepID=UPI0025ABA145|nr:uncharacterized protein LOC130948309 [Arachis stenosperma]
MEPPLLPKKPLSDKVPNFDAHKQEGDSAHHLPASAVAEDQVDEGVEGVDVDEKEQLLKSGDNGAEGSCSVQEVSVVRKKRGRKFKKDMLEDLEIERKKKGDDDSAAMTVKTRVRTSVPSCAENLKDEGLGEKKRRGRKPKNQKTEQHPSNDKDVPNVENESKPDIDNEGEDANGDVQKRKQVRVWSRKRGGKRKLEDRNPGDIPGRKRKNMHGEQNCENGKMENEELGSQIDAETTLDSLEKSDNQRSYSLRKRENTSIHKRVDLLKGIVPYINQLDQKQTAQKEFQAKRQGLSPLELTIEKSIDDTPPIHPDTHQDFHQPVSDQAFSPQEMELKELISAVSNLSHKIDITSQSSTIEKSPESHLPKELSPRALESLKRLVDFSKHTVDEWLNQDDLNNLLSEILSSTLEYHVPINFSKQVQKFKNFINNSLVSHNKLTDLKKGLSQIETESVQLDVSYASSQKNYKKYETNVAHAAKALDQLVCREEELEKELAGVRADIASLRDPFLKADKRKKDLNRELCEMESTQAELKRKYQKLQMEEREEILVFNSINEERVRLRFELEELLKPYL